MLKTFPGAAHELNRALARAEYVLARRAADAHVQIRASLEDCDASLLFPAALYENAARAAGIGQSTPIWIDDATDIRKEPTPAFRTEGGSPRGLPVDPVPQHILARAWCTMLSRVCHCSL